ncbi:MAG: type II secretion system protein [Balneola sp.]|nr:MAG: type II secretion system protein [Balneola sp.]
MVLKHLKKEDGFTIVEILVSITIVSIVLGIAGSVFFFINKQMIGWRANTEFYSSYSAIENRVFEDVLSATNVEVQDTLIVLNTGLETQRTYHNRRSPLLMNGANVEIYPMDTLFVNFQPSVILSEQLISWQLVQSKDRRSLTQDYMLSSRKPVLWKPLK